MLDHPRVNLYRITKGACRVMGPTCDIATCRFNTIEIRHGGAHKEQDRSVTCALALAEEGGVTLERIGAALGLTRERIRQLEVRAMSKIARGLEARGWARTDASQALAAIGVGDDNHHILPFVGQSAA